MPTPRMPRHIRAGARFAALALAGVFMTAPGAIAQDIGVDGWTVSCAGEDAARACAAQQTVYVLENGVTQRLLTILIQPDGEGGEGLLLALPHDVLFTAGIQVSVDAGTATLVPVQTSDPAGAYAITPLRDPLLSAMRGGIELEITFTTVERHTLTVPVSLEGFTAAFDNRRLGNPTQQ